MGGGGGGGGAYIDEAGVVPLSEVVQHAGLVQVG